MFIEAPRPALERVLEKHAQVRQLVENEWLYLVQLDAGWQEVLAWRQGSWVSTSLPPSRCGGGERSV